MTDAAGNQVSPLLPGTGYCDAARVEIKVLHARIFSFDGFRENRKRFIDLVQQNPMFAAQIRAPLYEDKVVDFLFSTADITERKATREQLEADLESEEGHIHGPGCGHVQAQGML